MCDVAQRRRGKERDAVYDSEGTCDKGTEGQKRKAKERAPTRRHDATGDARRGRIGALSAGSKINRSQSAQRNEITSLLAKYTESARWHAFNSNQSESDNDMGGSPGSTCRDWTEWRPSGPCLQIA